MKYKISFYKKFVQWDVVLRIIFGPLIFLSPPAVTVINLILDGFDGEIFKRSGYARPQYSIYDKILDYWWYIWVFTYILISGVPARNLFIFLFVYRTIGQILFLVFNEGFILFLFPNIFELVFFYYLIVKIFHQEQILMNGSNLIFAAVILTILGLSREVIIHIRKMNFSGVYLGKTTFWPIRTVNPYKAFIFLSLLLSFSFMLNQYMSIQTTETYTARAKKAEKSGSIISYDPTGKLMGMFYSHIDIDSVYLLKSVQNENQPYCRIASKPLLTTTISQGYIRKEVYIFSYEDICLRKLPDGSYFLSAFDKTNMQKDLVIEFIIQSGSIQH